jgi:hypothetical protein
VSDVKQSVTADRSAHDDIVRLLGDPRLSRWSKYLNQALAKSKKKLPHR